MRRIVQTINSTNTGSISGTTITGGIPIPLNFNNVAVGVGLVAEVTGTVNYTLYHTYDDVFNKLITPVWLPHGVANMVNATTTQESNFVIPVSACQLILNSGSGSINFVLLQQGII
jgi:hypothetical protein